MWGFQGQHLYKTSTPSLWEDTNVWYLLCRILQFCSVVVIAGFFYRYLNVKVTKYERPSHLHAGLCVQEKYQLRWVHTCNVITYRNAVTLQETDMIRSYELNFNPVPHGVTVSCEPHTLVFPVCYGSSGRWWRVTLPVHTCPDRNRTIPLMRRPNTDSTPNKP